MNILIVDDIATNRKLLRVTLEAEGHTTLEAADGVEALQILARETVDAVISDILMPNMDGFRLCVEIRKSERLHALPFIIYASTYTSPDNMKLAQTVGVDKYLIKPATTATVLAALREVMGKQPARPVPSAPPVEGTSDPTIKELKAINSIETILARRVTPPCNDQIKVVASDHIHRTKNPILTKK